MTDTVSVGDVTMTDEHDGTWTCSAGCPFVFQRDEFSDDVLYHLEWHAQTAIREERMTTEHWYDSHETLTTFGRWLFEKGHLDTADDVLSYFEKPWKWTPEYEEYRTEVDATIGRVHEH